MLSLALGQRHILYSDETLTQFSTIRSKTVGDACELGLAGL